MAESQPADRLYMVNWSINGNCLAHLADLGCDCCAELSAYFTNMSNQTWMHSLGQCRSLSMREMRTKCCVKRSSYGTLFQRLGKPKSNPPWEMGYSLPLSEGLSSPHITLTIKHPFSPKLLPTSIFRKRPWEERHTTDSMEWMRDFNTAIDFTRKALRYYSNM